MCGWAGGHVCARAFIRSHLPHRIIIATPDLKWEESHCVVVHQISIPEVHLYFGRVVIVPQLSLQMKDSLACSYRVDKENDVTARKMCKCFTSARAFSSILSHISEKRGEKREKRRRKKERIYILIVKNNRKKAKRRCTEMANLPTLTSTQTVGRPGRWSTVCTPQGAQSFVEQLQKKSEQRKRIL